MSPERLVGRRVAHRIGLDIGGTKMLAVMADSTGAILASCETPTPVSGGPQAVLAESARIVREVAGPGPIRHLGVGTAGVVDHRTGTILSATDALPGWAGTELALELSGRLDWAQVSVVNDVIAFSIGEGRFGAAAGITSFVAVTVGTGVGGSVVIDGTPLVGAHHLAGHVGHMAVPQASDRLCQCGRRGHVEAVASGPGMVESYRSAGGTAASLIDVAEALRAGDERAADAVRLAGQGLGTALASLSNVVDPRLIVVGGGALQVGELLLAETRIAFAETAMAQLLDLEIRPGALHGHAVALGASLLVSAAAEPPALARSVLPRRAARTPHPPAAERPKGRGVS